MWVPAAAARKKIVMNIVSYDAAQVNDRNRTQTGQRSAEPTQEIVKVEMDLNLIGFSESDDEEPQREAIFLDNSEKKNTLLVLHVGDEITVAGRSLRLEAIQREYARFSDGEQQVVVK